jgi:hypothetical protein
VGWPEQSRIFAEDYLGFYRSRKTRRKEGFQWMERQTSKEGTALAVPQSHRYPKGF